MNNYNEQMYGDRYADPTSPYTSSADTEMNVNWMRENPELAVEGIIKFFEQFNDKHFDHRCSVRFVPNRDRVSMELGYFTLGASRKATA